MIKVRQKKGAEQNKAPQEFKNYFLSQNYNKLVEILLTAHSTIIYINILILIIYLLKFTYISLD